METTILVILTAGLALFHNTNKPIEYALNMEDGSKTHVILKKNGQYACPIYCEADHTHKAILCDGNDEAEFKGNLNSVYHISILEQDGPPVYCSTQKILSMSKLTPQFGKDRIPDVINTSEEK